MMMRLILISSLALALAACDGGGVYSANSSKASSAYEGSDY